MLIMLTPEDVDDDLEYGYIYEDDKEEYSRYGAVEDLYIRSVKKDKTKFAPEMRGSSLPSTHSPQTKLLESAGCTQSS